MSKTEFFVFTTSTFLERKINLLSLTSWCLNLKETSWSCSVTNRMMRAWWRSPQIVLCRQDPKKFPLAVKDRSTFSLRAVFQNKARQGKANVLSEPEKADRAIIIGWFPVVIVTAVWIIMFWKCKLLKAKMCNLFSQFSFWSFFLARSWTI